LFDTGALLHSLSSAFANALISAYPTIGTSSPDITAPQILFGPAYKGIPLVATIATELASRGRGNIGYSYNRKEVKTHGEGGSIVGSSLGGGKKVLIIDDVITAGTAIRQAYDIVKAEGGEVVGLVVALDREERGQGIKSTVQEVEEELGVRVISVVKMRDITKWLKSQGREEEMQRMEAYRKEYGI
jgi:orotate phosphoribosyltransferase